MHQPLRTLNETLSRRIRELPQCQPLWCIGHICETSLDLLRAQAPFVSFAINRWGDTDEPADERTWCLMSEYSKEIQDQIRDNSVGGSVLGSGKSMAWFIESKSVSRGAVIDRHMLYVKSLVQIDWVIDLLYAKDPIAFFESFTVPGGAALCDTFFSKQSVNTNQPVGTSPAFPIPIFHIGEEPSFTTNWSQGASYFEDGKVFSDISLGSLSLGKLNLLVARNLSGRSPDARFHLVFELPPPVSHASTPEVCFDVPRSVVEEAIRAQVPIMARALKYLSTTTSAQSILDAIEWAQPSLIAAAQSQALSTVLHIRDVLSKESSLSGSASTDTTAKRV